MPGIKLCSSTLRGSNMSSAGMVVPELIIAAVLTQLVFAHPSRVSRRVQSSPYCLAPQPLPTPIGTQ